MSDTSKATPRPWIWRDGDGNILDLATWKSKGYYGNPQLTGPRFKMESNLDDGVAEWDAVLGCDEYSIISELEKHGRANAALIVQAVNSFDAMREALRPIVAELLSVRGAYPNETRSYVVGIRQELLERAEAALALAEGKEDY